MITTGITGASRIRVSTCCCLCSMLLMKSLA
jgi:hypothetical protein